MNRAEAVGLGAALVGHAVLFGLLSVGFLATPNPMELESTPLDVSLVDAVALQSAAPAAVEPPAQSRAEDSGPIEDAPPPAETVAEPTPTPPAPQPKPAPAPKPSPVSKPDERKPAETKEARRAEPRPAPAPAPTKKAEKPAAKSGSDNKAKAERPRGSHLSDDFLKGILESPSSGKSTTPRAQTVSATAIAGIGDAIRRQVQPCANRVPNPGPGANQITTKLRIRMKRDGTLAGRPEIRGQTGVSGENERYAQRVGELAAGAVIACAPYELPAELYAGGWEDIILNYKLPD